MYKVHKTRRNSHYLVIDGSGHPVSDYATQAEAVALALILNGVLL